MITGDPKRTPSFVMFANPDFYLNSGPESCGASCVSEPPGGDAWNHGDVNQRINTTWLGLVGPGVSHLGTDNALWSDHTDIQPTMMELLGLRDDYAPDGRVLAEVLGRAALPAAMRAHGATLVRLGQVYTQLEAAVGAFGLDTLRASTKALASESAHDAGYTGIEGQLKRLGAARDALALKMRAALLGVAFSGRALNERQARTLIAQGDRLLGEAAVLAASRVR
jgi:hypothetical protein